MMNFCPALDMANICIQLHATLQEQEKNDWPAWAQAGLTFVAMLIGARQFRRATQAQERDRRFAVAQAELLDLRAERKVLQAPFAIITSAAMALRRASRSNTSAPYARDIACWRRLKSTLLRVSDAAENYPVHQLTSHALVTSYGSFLDALKGALHVANELDQASDATCAESAFEERLEGLEKAMAVIWTIKSRFQRELAGLEMQAGAIGAKNEAADHADTSLS